MTAAPQLNSELTPEQIALIRDTFHMLEPDPVIAERFYDRLFQIAPELRSLFRPDMTGQGMRFMTTLGIIVQHLDDPVALEPYVRRLAEGHAAYGVKPAHFRPMGQALIDTMRAALGRRFPKGADKAWMAAYDHLARRMIELGG